METKHYSAIITTCDRETMLPRAIESVLAQTLAANEVIVIDDGTNEKTRALIKTRYPEIQYYRTSHQGISHARNEGIHRSSSHWLAFLDDDDIWQPEKLEQQFELIHQYPDIRLVHCNEQWIRNGQVLNQQKKHARHGGWIFQHCLPLCCISPSSVIIHRTVFDELGLFDERLPVCEDYDMWLRVTARYPVHLATDVLVVKYGGHAGQLSRHFYGMDRFRIMALHKCLQQSELCQDDYLAACEAILQKLGIWLNGAKKHGNHCHTIEFTELLRHYQRQSATLRGLP